MKIDFLNPPALGATSGWTHVVAATGGKTIYISGQVAANGKGEVVGKGDLRAQTIQVFENLKTCLAAAGATFKDVVKSNLYVVGLKTADVPIIRGVRAQYFSQEHPPCSTLVGVEKLVAADFLIEIDVIAVVA